MLPIRLTALPPNAKAPVVRNIERAVIATAAGSDAVFPAVVAPFDAVVTKVEYVAASTITGAATNNRTLSVTNKKGYASGTATVASLAFSSGAVVATGFVPKAITLSGTAADLAVAAGDVLVFNSTHIGTGIADPGGLVRITLERA